MAGSNVTLTERGQISVPAKIRKRARMEPGAVLRWEMISEREFRVTLADKPAAQGPYAAMGWLKRRDPKEARTTDEIMRELRAGDAD